MKKNIAVSVVFVWIGFVCAISFMEAWLKFRAPGITLPLGLGIGRLVFTALNRMEIIFLVITLVCLFPFKNISKFHKIIFLVIILLLVLQTFWLLPVLVSRAESYINGITPPTSKVHFYYVISEFIKVFSLLFFGFKLFSIEKNNVNKRKLLK